MAEELETPKHLASAAMGRQVAAEEALAQTVMVRKQVMGATEQTRLAVLVAVEHMASAEVAEEAGMARTAHPEKVAAGEAAVELVVLGKIPTRITALTINQQPDIYVLEVEMVGQVTDRRPAAAEALVASQATMLTVLL